MNQQHLNHLHLQLHLWKPTIERGGTILNLIQILLSRTHNMPRHMISIGDNTSALLENVQGGEELFRANVCK